jgi:hypothetical protein
MIIAQLRPHKCKGHFFNFNYLFFYYRMQTKFGSAIKHSDSDRLPLELPHVLSKVYMKII